MLPKLLTPPPYLDPGSGSLLIQLAIAALLGLGVLVRSQWARIKKLFGVKPAEIDEDNDDDKKDE
ncbi:hypothetical protein JZU68_08235 [bacterium]|jgi:hypothetical protein|nr:hypothetical protein [bacterium]